jgi:hypothetical protein
VLHNREQWVLKAGGGAVVVILIFSFLVIPSWDKIRSQGRARLQAEKELAELRASVPEVRALESAIRSRKEQVRAAGRGQDSPLSRLTARLQEAGFPQSAFSIKSGGVKEGDYFKEETYDIRIENRSYLEMARFLQKLEDGSLPVAVRSVTLKSRYENSSALDAVLRIGYLLPR